MIATAALRHAADVTHEDIGAVADFLRAALNHPDNVARPGTQAFRTNGAPRALVPQLEGSLSYQFHDELMAEAQRDRIKALERIQGIRRTWNQLIGIASFWKDVAGYDAERWRTVRFDDAEHEREYRQWQEKQTAAAAAQDVSR
ncbi:hypothetical protein HET65_24325 [Streptomyces sp. McG5]|uniref:hypothetical protein n=1 Tax=unclassified Streptomyces TaxID=2593676 RepID=UPI001BED003E|nr:MULTISPECIES: hypothetical protein [unclassified Streptomyces]MBT2877629.1 hypothetical protein [Streptomyces sp. McG6]MBT2887282.1 hypothetical protein [Streptomyces sp. McG5]MBT2889220.1 hypothetical protein [Streptomyces sp. McG2]